MADLFALERIHGDILFRNDDYIAPEKVGGGWVGGWVDPVRLLCWLGLRESGGCAAGRVCRRGRWRGGCHLMTLPPAGSATD